MRLLSAPDKFRGTATAVEVTAAMARACAEVGWHCVQLPLADGGEGTLQAFGGANRVSQVTGPLGEPVSAEWRLDGDLAVIEMALASGLLIAGGIERNDPVTATSRGTGELIAIARRSGARRVIVGVGGSASTDGGLGAVDALASCGPLDGTTGFSVTVATDVRTLFGEAAIVFGPQKGATTPVLIDRLTERLAEVAVLYRKRYGFDVTTIEGGGAAGGLAGGLASLGARIESGFELIQREVNLDAALADADLVITGEGRLDEGSFDGKVVGGVIEVARRAGVPHRIIVGQVGPGIDLGEAVVSLVDDFGEDRAYCRTAECIMLATKTLLQRVPRGRGAVRGDTT
jgi:glycerate kinase